MNNNVGEFIRNLRLKNNWTQKYVADKLYISDKTISKWECGAGMPDIEMLVHLANLFGVTVSEILDGKCKNEYSKEKINNKIFNTVKYSKQIDAIKIKRRIIFLIVIIFLFSLLTIEINYIMIYKNFSEPIFAISTYTHHIKTEEANYYEKNFYSLGYNYYTRGLYVNGKYNIYYVELSIF